MPHAVHTGTIHLKTLGRLDLLSADGSTLDDVLTRPKEFALIVYLAMASGRHVSRDSLLPLFWPELDESRARHSLRQMLYSLRRRLGPEGVVTRGGSEVRTDPDVIACDAAELLARAAAGEAAQTVGLYRGEFLPGFHPGDVSVELEQWIEETRGLVRRAAIRAARTLAEESEAGGDLTSAVRWSRKAVDIDLLSELDVHRLVRLLGTAESCQAALEVYERYRLRLKAELELAPGPELQQEVERIRREGPPPGQAVRGVVRGSGTTGTPPGPVSAGGAEGDEREANWLSRRLSRRSIVFSATALVAVGVVAGLRQTELGGPPAGASATVRVAIVPAPVSGERQPEAMQFAYASAWALEDVPSLTVVDPGTVQGLLERRNAPRHQDVVQLAVQELGADVVLTSHVWPAGDHWIALLELWDAGSTHVPTARTTVDLTHPSGDLATWVRGAGDFLRVNLQYGEEGAAAPLTAAGALEAFVLGDRHLYRGEPQAAIREFRRAVAADSGFALAWHRLSIAAGLAFNGVLADSAAERAGRGGRTLPAKMDLLIEARRAYRKGLPQQAEAALRTLLTMDPNDVEAEHQLAEVLFHFNPIRGRSAMEALPLFVRSTRLGAARPEALYHGAQLSLLKGDTAYFHQAAREVLSLSAAAYRAPQIRILQAHASGDAVAWRRELGRLASAGDFMVLSAAHNVAVYGRSPAAAAEVARLLTGRARAPDVRAMGYQVLAELAIAQGRPKEAWNLLEQARAMHPHGALVRSAYLAALPTVPVAPAVIEELRQRLQSLEAGNNDRGWIFPESELFPGLPDYLDGILALKASRPDQAARALRKLGSDPVGSGTESRLFSLLAQRYRLSVESPSSPETDLLGPVRVTAEQASLSALFSTPDLRYLYAQNAERVGHLRLALRLLATLEENSIPDLALVAPARLMAGRIHERLGETDEAGAAYRRAIELWHHAEPEFDDLVMEAWEGLGRLGLEAPPVDPAGPTEEI